VPIGTHCLLLKEVMTLVILLAADVVLCNILLVVLIVVVVLLLIIIVVVLLVVVGAVVGIVLDLSIVRKLLKSTCPPYPTCFLTLTISSIGFLTPERCSSSVARSLAYVSFSMISLSPSLS